MHGANHEVLGRLAVGGMAELYLARTTHEDGRQEVVVLKRILPHLAEDPEFVRMFRDEAYLAATLDHPNIVRVHDIGQDGEDYFFTMEYVHGENVRTIIKAAQKTDTPLPLRHVVEIAKGVCDGLHYAHERTDDDGQPLKIVHRDVSPTNILVSLDGLVKIVDFGIAKAAAATHVTQAGMLKGKASYMSPEQCRAQPVDRRSDVFAIGILMYEMTTLTRLFRGDNELAVLHQILTGTVEAPSTRVDEYDPELERIVLRALSQKAEDRYPTALALREELERFATLRGFSSSSKELGAFVRETCGEKPYPWDDGDEDERLEILEESGTGLPTSQGNFEDEEDTQVNRRAPALRTVIPGAPETWTEAPPPRDGPPSPPGPPPVTDPRPAPPATVPRPARKEAVQSAARGLNPNRPRLPGAPRGMGIPPDSAPPSPADSQVEPTTPMAKPEGARGSALRKTMRRGAGLPSKLPRPGAPGGMRLARSGRTLTGAAGGLAGPAPARSGHTLTGTNTAQGGGGAPATPGRSAPRPPAPAGAPHQAPVPRAHPSSPASPLSPSTAGPPRPPGTPPRPPGTPPRPSSAPPAHAARAAAATPAAATPAAATPGSTDRTEALTPEQAAELRRLGKSASPPRPKSAPSPASPSPLPSPGTALDPNAWSGPGVDRTEIAPPSPIPSVEDEVDEGARTLAMPRFDRTMLAQTGQDAPKGPTSWKSGQDPLTQTQKSPTRGGSSLTQTQKNPASSFDPASKKPPSALTSTQKNPASALTSTQRSPSAAFPTIGSVPSPELRRPEMRSPSPRPASTPRSLWVPVLVVVIVGLAGTAVWLWLSAAGATPASSSPSTAAPTTTPSSTAEQARSDEGLRAPSEPRPTPTSPGTTPSDDPPTDPPHSPELAAETADPAETASEGSGGPVGEPADDPRRSEGTRSRRPRRPRPSGKDPGKDPGPDPDLPELRPGRPVPP